MTAMPEVLSNPETQLTGEKEWRLIVWNDPVTLMSYVAYVFRSISASPGIKLRA